MISGFEQMSLFQQTDYQEAISCETNGKYPTNQMEDWMRRLVPNGEYVIHIGKHPMVLKPTKISKELIPTGHRFYHFIIAGKVYSGVFLGTN